MWWTQTWRNWLIRSAVNYNVYFYVYNIKLGTVCTLHHSIFHNFFFSGFCTLHVIQQCFVHNTAEKYYSSCCFVSDVWTSYFCRFNCSYYRVDSTFVWKTTRISHLCHIQSSLLTCCLGQSSVCKTGTQHFRSNCVWNPYWTQKPGHFECHRRAKA